MIVPSTALACDDIASQISRCCCLEENWQQEDSVRVDPATAESVQDHVRVIAQSTIASGSLILEVASLEHDRELCTHESHDQMSTNASSSQGLCVSQLLGIRCCTDYIQALHDNVRWACDTMRPNGACHLLRPSLQDRPATVFDVLFLFFVYGHSPH